MTKSVVQRSLENVSEEFFDPTITSSDRVVILNALLECLRLHGEWPAEDVHEVQEVINDISARKNRLFYK